MTINGRTDFVGPSRAKFMSWVADQVNVQDMGDAQAKAYLKSVYGDGIEFPDNEKRQICGGDIGDRYDAGNQYPLLREQRPKSVGPWIFLSIVAILVSGFIAFGLYWYLHNQSRVIPVVPAPVASPAAPQDYIQFY